MVEDNMEAYFDNSATTPVYPEVRDLVVKLMEQDYGNPSSLHQKGVDAARYVSDARDKIARLLKVQAKEIVFTSGGTESNNMALIGGALANRRAGNKIITTAVEHASVGSPLTFLEDMGFEIEASHHEVAPAQHELASIYSEANVAVDNNQLVMQTLKRIACQHGLKCLLHEKPFAGVNGSGKHNNWSITTDDGINLLEPGKTPHENIQFLLVLSCVLKAVDVHADLLRESAADPGNDHRLGANEAPPAIISVFLGEQLEDVVEQLISTGNATKSKKEGVLETGVKTLPDLKKDATDRNRTSPFAFTGNKFEFRMVGSRDSVAAPNIVLNTIVAEAFRDACDVLEGAENFEDAVHDLIKKNLSEHQRIIFNGDGYADEWLAEAERRGLPNIKSMVYAIPALTTDTAIKLFGDFKVFTEAELVSRAEVKFENYAKTINIEAKTMIDMASKQIIPAVIKYATSLAGSINTITAAGVTAVGVQKNLLNETSALLEETQKALDELIAIENAGCEMEDGEAKAKYYYEKVTPAMEALRAPVDKLEMIVDKEMWPMPSYGDLMFEV